MHRMRGTCPCGRAAPRPPPLQRVASSPLQHTVQPSRRSRPHLHRVAVRAGPCIDVHSTLSIPSGEVTIQPLQEDDVQGAGLLLARAFAGTPEAVRLDEAVRYMQERLLCATAASGLTLVARLVPTDPELLPPSKNSRLVGTVTLSFSAATRESFGSLAPPADAAYLANMAVDPKFRRQGIARAMLAACECAVITSSPVIWLHVRQADPAAQALYAGFGYVEVDRDKPKLGLFGLGGGGGGDGSRMRILMRRQLGDGKHDG